jgi:hypothetical protein
MSHGSPVSIVTGYGLDDQGVGVQVLVESRIFTSPCHPDQFWSSPSLPIQWVPGAFSPGEKRRGREADHSPVTSANAQKTRIYTSTPPYISSWNSA